jgi:hypothetical protein
MSHFHGPHCCCCQLEIGGSNVRQGVESELLLLDTKAMALTLSKYVALAFERCFTTLQTPFVGILDLYPNLGPGTFSSGKIPS